jgi:CubicO group peptidase (beta-lactamase class C family)
MKKVILLVSILSLLFVGCQSAPSIQYTYRPPENINDGFNVGTLEEVNIDSALIEKAINDINRGKYGEVHSMLIFKDNKLVLEEYFPGHEYVWEAANHHGEMVTWDRTMDHTIHSVTKSITSICIGIAVEKGYVESVHQSIFDYLPEHQHLNIDGKDKITIEHLLTMTSGLEWHEWNAPYSSRDNDAIEIWFQDAEGKKDPISYVLEKPLVDTPGTKFNYSGGNMIVLGEIIKHATGMDIDEFSGMYLFEPLGIESFNWGVRFPNGVIEAASGLEITPRAMAKIGVTFLNNGVWDRKQIISGQWVEESATPFAGNQGINVPGTDSRNVGYSYSWWTKQYPESGWQLSCKSSNTVRGLYLYYAGGWGGQRIIVFPELNAVVVFTGGNYAYNVKTFNILEKYVIPALFKPGENHS